MPHIELSCQFAGGRTRKCAPVLSPRPLRFRSGPTSLFLIEHIEAVKHFKHQP